MKNDLLRKRARDHLAARWNLLLGMGLTGDLDRRTYLRANQPHAERNIQNGRTPDGNGRYLPEVALKCDMDRECAATVTHVDASGFAYCRPHGVRMQASRRCRKLRPHEARRLERGQTITY